MRQLLSMNETKKKFTLNRSAAIFKVVRCYSLQIFISCFRLKFQYYENS